MTDVAMKIREYGGVIDKQMAYAASNEILLLRSQIDNLNGHRAADREEARREIERLREELAEAKNKEGGWTHEFLRKMDITCPRGTCRCCDAEQEESDE